MEGLRDAGVMTTGSNHQTEPASPAVIPVVVMRKAGGQSFTCGGGAGARRQWPLLCSVVLSHRAPEADRRKDIRRSPLNLEDPNGPASARRGSGRGHCSYRDSKEACSWRSLQGKALGALRWRQCRAVDGRRPGTVLPRMLARWTVPAAPGSGVTWPREVALCALAAELGPPATLSEALIHHGRSTRGDDGVRSRGRRGDLLGKGPGALRWLASGGALGRRPGPRPTLAAQYGQGGALRSAWRHVTGQSRQGFCPDGAVPAFHAAC